MAIVLTDGMELALPEDVVEEETVVEELTQEGEEVKEVNRGPRLIQITNLSPKASDKQIEELFAQIGPVERADIFPKDKNRNKYGVLVCFIEYADAESVSIAQHLTSTVFIDKPLVIVPCTTIPSEYEVIQLVVAMSSVKVHDNDIDRQSKQMVQTIAPTIPSHIANPMLGTEPQDNVLVAGISQNKDLSDSTNPLPPNVTLIAATGVPMPTAPTKLAEDLLPQKEREARRTVFIDNLHPCLTAEHVLNFFQFCGDVRFLRLGGEWMEKRRFAFIEFTDLASVLVALQYDGADFCNKRIRVTHSRHWVQKPPTKQTDAEKEQDALMKRLHEAQALIESAVNNDGKSTDISAPKRRRSRSRSHSRRHKPRGNSKSTHKKKSSRKSRSRSRSKKRSRSKERKRSKDRRRSKSKERKRSRERTSREKDRRSRSRDRKRRSRSRERR